MFKESFGERGSQFNLDPLNEQRVEQTIASFLERYKSHSKGFFILGPSGCGKSHFIRAQQELDWIDGDEIWTASGAHPERAWWLEELPVIEAIDARSDTVTKKAKERGLWIIGASNNWLPPDAIVIPDWEEHKRMIRYREEHAYDGGATSDRLDQVLSHRAWIAEWEAKGVPRFATVAEAAQFLIAR